MEADWKSVDDGREGAPYLAQQECLIVQLHSKMVLARENCTDERRNSPVPKMAFLIEGLETKNAVEGGVAEER
eukprot:gene18679-13454_t